MMTDKAPTFDDLIEEAARHYVRLQGAPKSRRYRKALLNWIGQSDDHAQAMDLVCRLWVASNRIDPPIVVRTPRRSPSPVRRFGYGLAGSLAAMAASLGAVIFAPPVHRVYSTQSYKIMNVSMADGTTVVLGPRTSMSIDESLFKRSIYLDKGVADIKVRHSFRSLHTYLRGMQIKDIGTHFVIANRAEQATVTLITGAIAILDPRTGREVSRLAPGGMISWASLKDVQKTTPRDTYQSLAWERHVIAFDNTPLPQAIEQLHDFTGVNVSLRGRAVSNIKISGTFRYDNPDVFFKSLKTIYNVNVVRIDLNNYVLKMQ